MATDAFGELDAVTAVQLGRALFTFLARTGSQPELDEFTWEDEGVSISAGFIELDPETAQRVLELTEN